MAEPNAITLQLQEIRKAYNIGMPSEVEVLHGIDLTIKRGEFVALIGPSGSGKSTLLNQIGLLDKPTSGELYVTGQATTQLEDSDLTRLRAKSIGFVFQFHNLLPEFTALENVMLPLLAARGRPDEAMKLRADISVEDNLAARRQRTKLTMLSRIATFIIIFVTVGLVLLSIPGVRDIGVTLVASAGLAGLAVGAAAQPALKSLIAGVQMALTEPINIDDVVIVEGEWGRIEDIRTTYVVVKIWDERRLIVPTSQFLEGAFQNWTKKTAQLLGSVMLYLDPATRIGPIRAEFERQIADNPRWDRRVQVVQVTETTRDAIEVRLLMSAKDSPTLFDLRCDIREGMLEWLADHQPAAFARLRLMNGEAEPETTGPAPDS